MKLKPFYNQTVVADIFLVNDCPPFEDSFRWIWYSGQNGWWRRDELRVTGDEQF